MHHGFPPTAVGRRVRVAFIENLESRQHLDATLNPVGDAYVRDGSFASTNYGDWQQIQAKQGPTDLQRQVYAKFDLTGVSGSISNAKLRIHARRSNTVDASFAVQVKAVADTTWGEMTTTWNNKPALGNTLGSVTIPGTTAGWVEIDITAYLQQAKANGQTAVSLAVVGAAATDGFLEMSSREATNKPQLVLTTAATTTTTLAAAVDTYARNGVHSNTNYGTLPVVDAKLETPDYTREAFVRYNAAGLSGTVTQAKLRFNAYKTNAQDPAAVLQVRPLTTPAAWSETALTWNNKPAYGASLGTITVPTTTAAWYELDVTGYVQQQAALGQTVIGFAVVGASSTQTLVLIGSKEGSNGTQLLVTTTPAEVPDPPATESPAAFGAAAASSTQVNLSWSAAGGATSYAIEFATGDGDFQPLATPGGSATTHAHAGLTPDTAYQYRIKANGPNGASAYAYGSAFTLALTAPAGLSAAAAASDGAQATLTWSHAAADETAFVIEMSTDGFTFGQLSTVNANTTTSGTSSLELDKTYFFRVRATRGGIVSAPSNVATFTTRPKAPTGLSATMANDSEANLTWSDNAKTETGYVIEVSRDGRVFTMAASTPPNATGWSVGGLGNGTSYVFRIRALGLNGLVSDYSGTATVHTPDIQTAAPWEDLDTAHAPQYTGEERAPVRYFSSDTPAGYEYRVAYVSGGYGYVRDEYWTAQAGVLDRDETLLASPQFIFHTPSTLSQLEASLAPPGGLYSEPISGPVNGIGVYFNDDGAYRDNDPNSPGVTWRLQRRPLPVPTEAKPRVSITAVDAVAYETPLGDEEATDEKIVFRVGRSGPTDDALSVTLHPAAGLARPGDDYSGWPGSVTIPAGEEFTTFTLTANPDALAEDDESVGVCIEAAEDYRLGVAAAEGQVQDLKLKMEVWDTEVTDNRITSSGLREIPILYMPVTGHADDDVFKTGKFSFRFTNNDALPVASDNLLWAVTNPNAVSLRGQSTSKSGTIGAVTIDRRAILGGTGPIQLAGGCDANSNGTLDVAEWLTRVDIQMFEVSIKEMTPLSGVDDARNLAPTARPEVLVRNGSNNQFKLMLTPDLGNKLQLNVGPMYSPDPGVAATLGGTLVTLTPTASGASTPSLPITFKAPGYNFDGEALVVNIRKVEQQTETLSVRVIDLPGAVNFAAPTEAELNIYFKKVFGEQSKVLYQVDEYRRHTWDYDNNKNGKFDPAEFTQLVGRFAPIEESNPDERFLLFFNDLTTTVGDAYGINPQGSHTSVAAGKIMSSPGGNLDWVKYVAAHEAKHYDRGGHNSRGGLMKDGASLLAGITGDDERLYREDW